jgi:fluoride exporter
MIKTILIIGSGGFIGSVARYFVSKLNLSVHLFSIPVGTLLVNITGSLLIGILMGISERSTLLTTDSRLFLMVGLCGGFTTFSSFTMENLTLMHNGQFLPVLVYTAASLLLGFLAVFFGYAIINLI